MNCYDTLILPVCQYLDFSTIWWMIWIGIGINASQIMYLLCWADWSLAGPVINKSYIFCDISIFQMMSWIWPDQLTSDLAEGDGMSLDKYLNGISDIGNIWNLIFDIKGDRRNHECEQISDWDMAASLQNRFLAKW